MRYQIGEKVVFLFETGGGIVRSIDSSKAATSVRIIYYVEDETTFERPFRENEIAKIHSTDYKLNVDDVDQIMVGETMEEINHIVHKESRTGYLKPIDVWEIDLHMESITDRHLNLTNTQILNQQMGVFKAFYKKARAKQIRKIIVIHGVGEGVLKAEVRLYLQGQEGVEFFDASYMEYGKGATQVEIHYNW